MAAGKGGVGDSAPSAADLLEGHLPVTDGAGLLPLQPLIDAGQVEVVVALCPDCRVVCTEAESSWEVTH